MNGDKDPARDRHRETIALFAIVGIVLGGGVLLTLAAHLGYLLTGRPTANLPISPVGTPMSIAMGTTRFPPVCVIVLLVEILALAAGTLRVAALVKQRRPTRVWIDARAPRLAHGADLDPLGEAAVRERAQTLRVVMPDNRVPGVHLGRSVIGRRKLYGDYETLHLDVWGPRMGKTTSRAIPAICEAPGAALVTSNKRDIVDSTRLIREQAGTCWVFDPQGVAGTEDPAWWWNPLADIVTDEDAAQLASHFADGDDGVAVRKDPFFDPEGETLLASLFMVAALDRRPITQVFEWVSQASNPEPVHIMERLGDPIAARELRAQYEQERKTRAGVFATARKMARCLKQASIRDWVTNTGPERPRLNPAALATNTDTLYLLSMNGVGSCGPLVNALVVSVMQAATHVGSRSPMGRLPTPMVCVLDEAANVVRWKELPEKYSHFGSRGLVVLTILQSWAQGQNCWGHDGMVALWSAAGVRVIGGGVDDHEFLRQRSELIGDHEELRGTVSHQRGGTSRTYAIQEKRTLTPADLAAMPRGRALLSISGMRPTLIATVPWWERDYAEQVRASNTAYSPDGDEKQAA